MKVKSISMRPGLAQASHDGAKTETRRLGGLDVLNHMHHGHLMGDWHLSREVKVENGVHTWNIQDDVDSFTFAQFKCRVGQVGDILYVKEEHYVYGQWVIQEGKLTRGGKMKWMFQENPTFRNPVYYSDKPPTDLKKISFRGLGWYKRLARFMPRKYARTYLQITDIKLQRVQDITQAEAKAEGVMPGVFIDQPHWKHGGEYYLTINSHGTYRDGFKYQWMQINGRQSWDQNHWVWVIKYERLPADIENGFIIAGKSEVIIQALNKYKRN